MVLYNSSCGNKSKSPRRDCGKKLCLTNEEGFSYLEILIALAILAMAFLVLLPGITSLLAGEVKQEADSFALSLAGNAIEETKALDSNALELLQESGPQTIKVETEGREYWVKRSAETTPPDDENVTGRLWNVEVSVYDVDPETVGASLKCHLETSIFTFE